MMEINVRFHDPEVRAELERLHCAIRELRNELMSKIDDLTAAVAAEKTVEDSAVALLSGIAAQLTAALASSTPDAAVQTVIDSINANTASLSAAVTANTPTPPAA